MNLKQLHANKIVCNSHDQDDSFKHNYITPQKEKNVFRPYSEFGKKYWYNIAFNHCNLPSTNLNIFQNYN